MKKITFALIMGVITTGIISFTVIFVNIGFKPNFLKNMVEVVGACLRSGYPCNFDHCPTHTEVSRLVIRKKDRQIPKDESTDQ